MVSRTKTYFFQLPGAEKKVSSKILYGISGNLVSGLLVEEISTTNSVYMNYICVAIQEK
jgi:hypothetical protein